MTIRILDTRFQRTFFTTVSLWFIGKTDAIRSVYLVTRSGQIKDSIAAFTLPTRNVMSYIRYTHNAVKHAP